MLTFGSTLPTAKYRMCWVDPQGPMLGTSIEKPNSRVLHKTLVFLNREDVRNNLWKVEPKIPRQSRVIVDWRSENGGESSHRSRCKYVCEPCGFRPALHYLVHTRRYRMCACMQCSVHAVRAYLHKSHVFTVTASTVCAQFTRFFRLPPGNRRGLVSVIIFYRDKARASMF